MAWAGRTSRYVDASSGVWALGPKVDGLKRSVQYVGLAAPDIRHQHLLEAPLAMNCFGWFLVLSVKVDGLYTRALEAGRAAEGDITPLGDPYKYTNRPLIAANEEILQLKGVITRLEADIKLLLADKGSDQSAARISELEDVVRAHRAQTERARSEVTALTERLTRAQAEELVLNEEIERLNKRVADFGSYASGACFRFKRDGDYRLPDARTYGWRVVCVDGKSGWASTRYDIKDNKFVVTQEGDLIDGYWSDGRPQTLISRYGRNFDLLTWRDGIIFEYSDTPTGVVFTVLGYSQHWCVKVVSGL